MADNPQNGQSDRLTFFGRLEDEIEEAAAQQGVFNNIFGRFWRSEPTTSSTPASNGAAPPSSDVPPPAEETSVEEQFQQAIRNGVERRPSVNSQRNNSSQHEEAQRKISGRLSALFGGKKTGLKDLNKQYWMPDSTGKECFECEERFTAFRRRHHCRLCGQIFCARCCHVHVPGQLLGYTGDLRLCLHCAKMVAQYLPESMDREGDEESGLGLEEEPPIPPLGAPSTINAGIATVSNGPLMWSGRPGDIAAQHQQQDERKDSFSLPPAAYRPPAMLCVEELMMQHSGGGSSGSSSGGGGGGGMGGGGGVNGSSDSQPARMPSLSVGSAAGGAAGEEEESGPDWLRNMDVTSVHSSENKSALPSRQSSAARFDVPHSLTDCAVLDREKGQEEKGREGDRSSPSTQRKQTLAARFSQSPPLSPNRQRLSDDAGAGEGEDDVERAFARRTERLLDYLMQRESVDAHRWKSELLRVSQRIASTVRVDVCRRRDNMNILTYVHVKKLVVDEEGEGKERGDKPSAEIVWGVVCSGSLAHRSMVEGELHAASVMIVAGSIEYERAGGRLTALEPILCQEAEFLHKQVERILSRRPSLLLVERGVSRVAAELLRAAGVRLVIGVRGRVLQRVARSTNADILPSSDAQLIQQNIGFCPRFQQRTVRVKGGREKTLLVFDECPVDRGCTVLLRSSCPRELRAVKRILRHMVAAIYSAGLERAYLGLFDIRLAHQMSTCEVCEARNETIEEQNKSPFEDALAKAVLSVSPFVEFEAPFLETERGRSCQLLPYFRQPLYRHGTPESFEEQADSERAEEDAWQRRHEKMDVPSAPRHPFAVSTTVTGGGDEQSEDDSGVASFRALGGRMFRRRVRERKKRQEASRVQARNEQQRTGAATRREDVLDPYVHQRVAILFGSYSPKSPNAPYCCVRPWVVPMEFYGTHDMTLGEFLTKFCFSKEYACPHSNCDVSMLEHSRKMVYGRVCVEVTTQQVVQSSSSSSGDDGSAQQIGGGGNAILTWHYCPTCKASSALVPLNHGAWHLSFGKYLEYIGAAAFARGAVSSPSSLAAGGSCQHCFFHQHTHFFSMHNYVTTFKITAIRPYHVCFSPVVCRVQPALVSLKACVDGVTRMSALAEDTCRVAAERLDAFTKHEHYSQYAGTFHTVLSQLVDKTMAVVGEKSSLAEELRVYEKTVMPNNDVMAIRAEECLMSLREAIYQLITTWNDQSSVLGAQVRAMKKAGEESGGAASEIGDLSLERIDDPFPSYLHLGLKLHPRVGVVVRDIQDSRGSYKPDLGSIIAYALSSVDYQEQRRRQREAAGGEEVAVNLNASSMPSSSNEEATRAEHAEIEFQDNTASYYVKAHFAERFRLLRKLLFADGEDAFIRSLAQTTFWNPQGGKSGAHFYITQDERFVVKQLSRFEMQSFVKFAPRYFEYVKTAVTENKLTTLCKVYGVFKVGYKARNTSTQVKMDVLVMEYLFYKKNIKQVWDLKGSLRNRMAHEGKSSSDLVLMDENFMKDLWNNLMYVHPHAKAALNQAISNDSHFLSSQHIMDYSLLCGVDEASGELVLGIVDYMRTYTLDKKLETWVKVVAIPGSHLPTIISPENYCTRFSEAIDMYFPVVPDQWTGLGSAMTY